MTDPDYEQLLGELLSRIHGDGGHHIRRVGWMQAVADARSRIVELEAERDRLRDVLDLIAGLADPNGED